MAGKQRKTASSPGQVLSHQEVRRIPRLDIVKLKNRIGTWNVRTLYAAGKLANAIKEMDRLEVDVLGLSETRWPNNGFCQNNGKTFYYSGADDTDAHHRNGVGFLIKDSIKKHVKNIIALSDRIMMLQLEGAPININIIQVYAPTADKPDNEAIKFYEQLRELLKTIKKHEIIMILGDFNAKVGRGAVEGVIGGFGLGNRNDRGEMLIQFCTEEEFVIKNTYYDLPRRKLYTWKSPQDNKQLVVRNQIDYFLINKRYQNNIKRVAAYPGADIGSDHNPLIGIFKFRGKLVTRKTNNFSYDISSLKVLEKRDELKINLERRIGNDIGAHLAIEQQWETIKTSIQKATEDVLGRKKREAKKEWMTNEILVMMEERRLAKGNALRYNEIHREIRCKIRVAKNAWMTEQCREAEDLHTKHDSFNFHKKLKEITNTFKKTNISKITKNNKILTDTQDICDVWEEYIKDLFEDIRTVAPGNISQDASGPPILQSEVVYALSTLKNKKTPGEDNIHTEVLKLVDPSKLCQLFNAIYDTGDIPDDWLSSTFVAIPKKPNAKSCEEHRLISLMSHVLKAFLKIIHKRIYQKCEDKTGHTQFGFKNGLGTREALYCMQLLTQKCYDQRKDVFICFIDYQKAFDNVRHDLLLPILQEAGLDEKDIRIIHKLYWDQTAKLRFPEASQTKNIKIARGVRQGCILSPLLFNLYVEKIFQVAFENQETGIKVNGIPISNLRYADDTAILADNIQDLQTAINAINTVGKEHGLEINIRKTKLMIVGHQAHDNAQLFIDNQQIERVNKFKYLGATLNSQWDCDEEVKTRIAIARSTFVKFNNYLLRREVPLTLRLRVVECYIWPILLYGVETWSLRAKSLNRIEAFEIWILRRMLKISWMDHITNEEVLRRANTDRQLLDIVKHRKTSYLGHILRGPRYNLLKTILMGKIEGKRGPGRKQHSWLRNIRNWCGIPDAATIFRRAEEGTLHPI